MKTKHTSWFVAPDRKDLVFVPGAAQPMRCGSAERAHLVAAAPELLDVCQRLVAVHAGFPAEANSLVGLARAAIAAATGEKV